MNKLYAITMLCIMVSAAHGMEEKKRRTVENQHQEGRDGKKRCFEKREDRTANNSTMGIVHGQSVSLSDMHNGSFYLRLTDRGLSHP